MAVPFVQIPDILLVPGQYQEIDNSLAGSVSEVKRALIIGYKSSAGNAETGKPIQVLSAGKAGEQCGWGSPAALMAEAFLDLNKIEECWILPVAEPEGGTPWQKPFTIRAENAAAGLVSITVNGKLMTAAVSAGANAAAVAAAIAAKINSEQTLPVEAEVDTQNTSSLKVRSIVPGTAGNRNTVSIISASSGVSISEGTVTKGNGVSDLTKLLKGLGEPRYHYIVFDFDDEANMKALADELESRYSAMRQIGGRAFVALSGEVGSVTENGSILAQAESVNSPHIVLIPRMNNPQLPCEWAARFAASCCRVLADDPSANTYDLQVTGLSASAQVDADTRQKLLEAGIATWRIDTVGNVLVERLVTSYTENTDGGRDTSYLDVQVTETVDAVRSYINAEAKKRFKTWKLASTEENFGRGAKVMTPGVWRSFLADLYLTTFIQDKQWCQNFETYKKSIFVEVKKDSKTRLEYIHQPVLIGQFLIGSGLLQFQ